jgi:hypothetical protein
MCCKGAMKAFSSNASAKGGCASGAERLKRMRPTDGAHEPQSAGRSMLRPYDGNPHQSFSFK